MSVEPVTSTAGATVRATRPRDEGLFWIAREILRADSDAVRAAILLRIPDLVLAQKAEVLSEACTACQFGEGAGYISVRLSVACANRDPNGRLPSGMARLLEMWRCSMVALAAGEASR